MRTYRARLALCIAVIVASSCAVNRYKVPVGDFRNKTIKSTSVLADFYVTRNQYEVDLYLNEVAVDPKLEVLAKNPDGTPTPLGKPVFSPGSLKARLDALDLIGAYANRLADLASSEAPAKFKDAASLLGQNLTTLSNTFSGLASGGGDPTAIKYVGPVGKLIGAIGEMILEQKRDQLISAGINKAAPEVDTILGQVKNDLDTIFSLQLSTGATQRLATLVAGYNVDRERLSYQERKIRLSEIRDAAALRSTEIASAPSSLVTSMSSAHQALVKLAMSKRQPSDFSQFNSALELWATRIEDLATQVKAVVN
jgi:hypothetical protein